MKVQGKKILILIGGVVSIFIILFMLRNIFKATDKEISHNVHEITNEESTCKNENIIVIISEEDNAATDNETKEVQNEKEFENRRKETKEQKRTDNKNEEHMQKREDEANNTIETKKQVNKKQNNTKVSKDNNTNTDKSNNQILNTVEPKKENTNKEQNNIVENAKKEENTVKTENPVEVSKDQHTYKYNEGMVEKIKNDIKNNESIYMKQYGYEIVVDESIIEQTNQFTYTQNRVKNMIRNKCGTIRVYARDYYWNGSYQYTEAYIL